MKVHKKIVRVNSVRTVSASEFADLFQSYEQVLLLLEDFLIWSLYEERRGSCSMERLAIDVVENDMPSIREEYRRHFPIGHSMGLGDPALGSRHRDRELDRIN
jgi:hypothetical protein